MWLRSSSRCRFPALPFIVGGIRYGVPDQNYIKHMIYSKQMFPTAGSM
jgi:hypothetical protein